MPLNCQRTSQAGLPADDDSLLNYDTIWQLPVNTFEQLETVSYSLIQLYSGSALLSDGRSGIFVYAWETNSVLASATISGLTPVQLTTTARQKKPRDASFVAG